MASGSGGRAAGRLDSTGPVPVPLRRSVTPGAIAAYLAAVAALSLMDACAKWLAGRGYPVGEIVCLRSLFSLAPLIVVLAHGGLPLLHTVHPLRHLARGVAMAFTIGTFFMSLALMPLAAATAVFATGPLFMVLLASPLLGELLRGRDLVLTLGGLVGVALVLQPTAEALGFVALLPLLAALGYALAMIATRRLSQTESAAAVVFWGNLVVLIFSLTTATAGWRWPGAVDLTVFVLMGCAAGASHMLLVAAYRRAPVGALSPFDYTSILWALAFGYAVWSDIPGAIDALGMALVAVCGVLAAWPAARSRG